MSPKQLMKEMVLELKGVFPDFIPEYKISHRGVPYVRLREYSICYFKKSNFYRIFVDNKGIADIKGKEDVVSFFKNEEINAETIL